MAGKLVFTAVNLEPRIGTEIETDRETLLSGSHAQEIRHLLEERGVLVFRNIGLDDDEQLAFAKTIGQVVPQGDKGLYKITLDQTQSDTADLLRGTFCWHFDGAVQEIPRASMLSPRRISASGGETEFANVYAAYDDLPESEKTAIDKLRVVHVRETLHRTIFPNPTEAQLERWRSTAPKTRPLVWTHKSGRKSLLLGLTATSIEGMDAGEGRALIDRLQDLATQPQFVYRHEWKMGDLLIWDNTGVLHRALPYSFESGRMLHRTTLVGEEAPA
jgi:alpha-ketoglutarate-dependent taurine dioxygenase